MRGLGLGLSINRRGNTFSPASITASAWYDPSDLSTMFKDTAGTQPVTADGDAVARINDKSGNGRHLTQATAGSRPLYKTSGGLSWLQFDGTDDYLSGGDILDLGTGGYFCSVAVQMSNAAFSSVFAKSVFGPGAGRYGISRDSANTQSLFAAAAGPTNATAFSDTDTANRILTAKVDRGAGTNRLRFNGVNQGADATFAAESNSLDTASIFLVGAYNDGTGTGVQAGYYLNGKVFGLILKLAATPSDAEISSCEGWLGGKCGVSI